MFNVQIISFTSLLINCDPPWNVCLSFSSSSNLTRSKLYLSLDFFQSICSNWCRRLGRECRWWTRTRWTSRRTRSRAVCSHVVRRLQGWWWWDSPNFILFQFKIFVFYISSRYNCLFCCPLHKYDQIFLAGLFKVRWIPFQILVTKEDNLLVSLPCINVKAQWWLFCTIYLSDDMWISLS